MSIKFEASADFSQLVAENAKYQKSLVTLTEKVEKLEKQASQMAAAAGKAAQQFAAANTPLGQYQRTVDKLTKQMASGTITQQEFAAAVSEADKKYEASKKSLDGATNKVSDHKGALSGLGSQIKDLAVGYVGWTAVLTKAGEAMQFVREETNKAKDSLRGLQPAEGALAQIAKDTDQLAAMSADADRMAAKYGVGRDKVRMAMVEGANFAIDPGAIEQMVKYDDFVSVAAQTTVAGKIPSIFGKEEISPQEAVSVGLVAAGSSAASFEQMATGLPKLAEGGRSAGATPAESMAALSVLAAEFASADTAADRLKALGGKMGMWKQTQGKGYIEGVKTLQGMRKGARNELFGENQEVRAAYEAFTANMDQIQAQTDAAEKELATMRSGGESFVEHQYRNKFDSSSATTDLGREYVAVQRGLEDQRKAAIEREIANEKQLATGGISRETAQDRQLARQKEEGRSGFVQYATQAAGNAAEMVGADVGWTTWAMQSMDAALNPLRGYEKIRQAEIDRTYAELEGIQARTRLKREMEGGSSGNDIQEKQLAAIEKQTNVLQEVADLMRGPRSGASTAAAAPNPQRQGR